MKYLGIDVGKKGGITEIDGDIVRVYPYDDDILIQLCRTRTYQRACVEKVGAMPKQGVVSMFHFGKSAGFIEGVLRACGVPYQLITPQTWKKEFNLIGKSKKESIATCKRLFPDIELKPTPRSRTDSDGMAEATLMAEYARRKL